MLISPEVLAAVLSFILTSVGAWFLARRQVSTIAITLVSQSSQVLVSRRVRENLEIKYKAPDGPRAVDRLVLTTLTISNKGLRAVGDEIETRKKVEIKLWVHADNYDESLFIAAEVADPQEKTEPLVYNASPTREDGAASWEITFKRPFLHSDLGLGGKAPQERIQLAILSNTNVTLAKVAGTGLGWRARIRPDYTALNRALFIFVGALILFFVLAAIIRLFQLDLDEPISASIFAILFVTDLLVGIGALAAVLWFATVRLLERTLRGFKRS